MHRTSLPLLTFVVCLALGLLGGLAYAWVVAPAPPPGAPDRLNAVDRDLYLRLVAAAYAADGDQARAIARLDALGEEGRVRLVALATEDIIEGREPGALSRLATDLGLKGGAMALIASARPLPPATTEPTAIATSTIPPVDVTLVGQTARCEEGGQRIVVHLVDGRGEPLTGVAVTARWDGGQSVAYTGFSATGEAGTADFVMAPGVVYGLEVGGAIVTDNLGAPMCADGLQGGWEIELEFRD